LTTIDAYGRVGSDDREVDELMNILAKSPNRAAIGDRIRGQIAEFAAEQADALGVIMA
jgi:hypothetical protein